MLAGIDNELASRRSVLLYVRGSFHFPLIEPIVRENPDVEFYLHSNLFGNGEVERQGLLRYPNFHFVSGLDELKYKLDRFGAFITTDAEPANPHTYSLRLIEFFNAIKVPVFELQHGLFQLGLHYFDVPTGFGFGGDSLPAKSFADKVLAYYPPLGVEIAHETIGYPPFDGKIKVSKGSEWTLVLSNLHWPTYTHDERRAFYESVYRLAAEKADAPVVWKLHHAEIASRTCTALHQEMAVKYPAATGRLRFHDRDSELSPLCLSELIARARVVVSTVSTVLLDCEMQGKRVALYECPSIACLTRRLDEKDLFSSSKELFELLAREPKPLKTGVLRPFDNTKFRKALDSAYVQTTVPRSELLNAISTIVQPLNSELRWHLVTQKKAFESQLKSLCTVERVDGLSATVSERAQTILDAVQRSGAEVGQTQTALQESLKACCTTKDADRIVESIQTEAHSVAGAVRTGLTSVQEGLNALGTRVSEEVSARAVVEDRANKAESRVADLTRRIAVLEFECATLREQIGLERKAHSEQEKLLAERQSALESVRESLSGERAEIARLTEGNTGLRRVVESKSEEVIGLQTQLASLAKECDVIRAERDKARLERADRIQRVEGLKIELATARRLLKEESAKAESQRKATAKLENEIAKLTSLIMEDRRKRTMKSRLKCMVKGILPYGVVCAWKRMCYGEQEDRPLFAYPGVLKRAKRIVKFASPYGMVKIYKEFKGK